MLRAKNMGPQDDGRNAKTTATTTPKAVIAGPFLQKVGPIANNDDGSGDGN